MVNSLCLYTRTGAHAVIYREPLRGDHPGPGRPSETTKPQAVTPRALNVVSLCGLCRPMALGLSQISQRSALGSAFQGLNDCRCVSWVSRSQDKRGEDHPAKVQGHARAAQ